MQEKIRTEATTRTDVHKRPPIFPTPTEVVKLADGSTYHWSKNWKTDLQRRIKWTTPDDSESSQSNAEEVRSAGLKRVQSKQKRIRNVSDNGNALLEFHNNQMNARRDPDTQERAPPPNKCPKGHTLLDFVITDQSGYCDGCKEEIKTNDKVLVCHACSGWLLCRKCHPVLATAPPPQPPDEPQDDSMLVEVTESEFEHPLMIGSDIADEESESETEPIQFGTVPPPSRNQRRPKTKSKAKAKSKGHANKNSRKAFNTIWRR